MDDETPDHAHLYASVEQGPAVGSGEYSSMRDVSPPQSAPKPGTTINALENSKIAQSMRDLIGRSPFQDPHKQAAHDRLMSQIVAGSPSANVLVVLMSKNLATSYMESERLQRVKEVAIIQMLPAAAREILLPGYNHFVPPRPSTTSTEQLMMAHLDFMMRAEPYLNIADVDAIHEAEESLIDADRSPSIIADVAYILALPTIERLERLLATKSAEQENLIEQIIRHNDRVRRKSIDQQG